MSTHPNMIDGKISRLDNIIDNMDSRIDHAIEAAIHALDLPSLVMRVYK